MKIGNHLADNQVADCYSNESTGMPPVPEHQDTTSIYIQPRVV